MASTEGFEEWCRTENKKFPRKRTRKHKINSMKFCKVNIELHHMWQISNWHSFQGKPWGIFGANTADICGGNHKKTLTQGHWFKSMWNFSQLNSCKEKNCSWVIHLVQNVLVPTTTIWKGRKNFV